jgi:hypothetical protein
MFRNNTFSLTNLFPFLALTLRHIYCRSHTVSDKPNNVVRKVANFSHKHSSEMNKRDVFRKTNKNINKTKDMKDTFFNQYEFFINQYAYELFVNKYEPVTFQQTIAYNIKTC